MNKVKKTTGLFLIVCLVLSMVFMPLKGGMVYAKKTIKKVVVKNQKQLNKALKNKLIKNIEIKSGAKKLKVKYNFPNQ